MNNYVTLFENSLSTYGRRTIPTEVNVMQITSLWFSCVSTNRKKIQYEGWGIEEGVNGVNELAAYYSFMTASVHSSILVALALLYSSLLF